MLDDPKEDFERILSKIRTKEKKALSDERCPLSEDGIDSSYLFTSESVTEGHPDKICDQISDAILDAYLEEDPDSRCAIECLVTEDLLVIAGEVSSKAKIKHGDIARDVISDIGYLDSNLGFYNKSEILDQVHVQSPELSKNSGAGDSGIVVGYACNQTDQYLPLPIVLAHKLTKRLAEVRKENIIEGLYPDGKAQVTVRYENRKPIMIDTIIISTHHSPIYKGEKFYELKILLLGQVVKQVIPSNLITEQTEILFNPAGEWSGSGGPKADTGLTGRKIMVDTYGGWARHGGRAFSGKDASKVDRSGAYMARYIAKKLVHQKFAEECEIQLGYSIGKDKPVSVNVNTFGTSANSNSELLRYIYSIFHLSVSVIIKKLELKKPIYRQTSNYGHFMNGDLPWERECTIYQEKKIALHNHNNALVFVTKERERGDTFVRYAKLIRENGKFYYAEDDVKFEVTEYEYDVILSNPMHYYFTTALRMHIKAQRLKDKKKRHNNSTHS